MTSASPQTARAAQLGRRAFIASVASAVSAHALGRTPVGGALRLRLPFPVTGLDPHVLDDPLSALFAPAVLEPLFALDASGKPYPTLASALPERASNGARLSLRAELVTSRGKPLTAQDLIFSIKRAQALGGAAVLNSFHAPSADGKDNLTIFVPGADPDALARALASPLTALVPRNFSPLAPDGSGAFSALMSRGTLTLTRNEHAARGASFLDRIEVTAATDLADALRAFEAGSVDVGWLGNGLYRPRAGALALEGPVFGWIVLRSGLDAKGWGAPGVAQQVCAALPADALAHFGVRALPHAEAGVRWGGGPSSLLVPDDSPHLLELARALEPLLSSAGNEIRTQAAPRASYVEARHTRKFGLMLDFVRATSIDPADNARALLTAVDPALAKRPPRAASLGEIARTLPLGVLGETRVSGARVPQFVGLETWQLSNVWSDDSKR